MEDGALSDPLEARYAGWGEDGAQKMLAGEWSLDQVAQWVEMEDINPQPVSGRQELLENILNRYV